jgi:hypothetical protein
MRGVVRRLRLRSRRSSATLVFVGAFLGSVAFLTRNYQYDGLAYLLGAEVDISPSDPVFHPHHPLFCGLLRCLARVVRSVAPGSLALVPAQIASALAGAVGVTALFSILRRALDNLGIALAGAALLFLSYGPWHYSTEPEPYAGAQALFLLAVVSVQRDRSAGTSRHALVGGILHALAIGFHQIHALGIVVLVGLLLAPRGSPGRAPRGRLLAYLAAVVIGTAGIYCSAAAMDGVPLTPEGLYRWSTHYAQVGRWGGVSGSLLHGAGGAFTSVLAKEFVQDLLGPGEWTMASTAGAVVAVVIGTIVLGLLLIGLCNLRALSRRSAFLLRFCLLSAVVYAPFVVWWESHNPKFWILLLPALWAFVAMTCAAAPLAWLSCRAARILLPGLCLAIGAFNLVFAILPESRLSNNQYYKLTAMLVERLEEEDLIVGPLAKVSVYSRYFFGRRLQEVALHKMPAGTPDYERNRDWLHRRIEEHLARGFRVFLAENEFHPPLASAKQLTVFARGQYEECYRDYASRLRPVLRYQWYGVQYTLYEIDGG